MNNTKKGLGKVVRQYVLEPPRTISPDPASFHMIYTKPLSLVGNVRLRTQVDDVIMSVSSETIQKSWEDLNQGW